MRHRTVSALFGIAGLLMAGSIAHAQFLATDWLLHRGSTKRQGFNSSDPQSVAAPPKKTRVWDWPRTADMPAESVVDNTNKANLPGTMFPAGGGWGPAPGVVDQQFALAWPGQPGGNNPWIYPSGNTFPGNQDRGAGAWPPSDVNTDKIGDYWYTPAIQNTVLNTLANLSLDPANPATTGLSELLTLPNLSDSLEQPTPGAPFSGRNWYKTVNDELLKNTIFARWTFGTHYPNGTFQGAKRLPDGTVLAPSQRYAVYVRFPSPSPNLPPQTDYVFVRVSWGDIVNDPTTSRIFLLDTRGTNGFWMRVRSSLKEDRYFPYDGVHPITVTVYGAVPFAANEAGFDTAVTADAVRLVPEAMRGDIHAPAASFHDQNNNRNLTYFARDETVGPRDPNTPFDPTGAFAQPTNFTPIPRDPTHSPTAPNGANPQVNDISSSVRVATFYCVQDQLPNGPFGKVRWRHTAILPYQNIGFVDDSDPINFKTTGPGPFTNVNPGPGGYLGQYTTVPSSQGGQPVSTGTWSIPVAPTGYPLTYTVAVWMPTGNAGDKFAQNVHYALNTTLGTHNIYFDQDNAIRSNGGGWKILATGVRFSGQSPTPVTITVSTDSFNDNDFNGGRIIAMDGVEIIPESQDPNTVVAAPLIASVTWPSGTTRKVIYYATTGGQLWALDALGVAGAGTADNSLETTVYWTYPSISNPDPANFSLPKESPDHDPNNLDDPGFSPPGGHGVDGDLETITVNGVSTKIRNPFSKTPDLGAFVSSPMYIEVQKGGGQPLLPMILVGNNNGRVYAFDPVGRTNTNIVNGPVGEPFPLTLASIAPTGGDVPSVPGTTRRIMTWPTVGRDKWLLQGAPGQPNADFATKFPDDPNKVSVTASLSANWVSGNTYPDHAVVGAGDGHVYSIELAKVDPSKRISNFNSNQSFGQPLWTFPNTKLQLGPVTQTGALTDDGRYIFTAPDAGTGGGRVYAITDSVNPQMRWVYPFTGTPGANPNQAADKLPELTPFTAPVWVPSTTTDAGAGMQVVYIANTDGRVFAFDASQTGGQQPNPVWKDRRNNTLRFDNDSLGTTRGSAVYIHWMAPLSQFSAFVTGGAAPAILIPLDTGQIEAYSAVSGRQLWFFPDGAIGYVPLTVPNPPPPIPPPAAPVTAIFSTSAVFRGADIITANSVPIQGLPNAGGWLYEGDEGNQNTGEVNGQMRAYSDGTFAANGTEGEPDINPEAVGIDIRLVDVWNNSKDSPPGPWDLFINSDSPFNHTNDTKPVTQGNTVVYEWGDTINVAAWGAFVYDPTDPKCNAALPVVNFRLYTGTQTREASVTAFVDTFYNGPPLTLGPNDPGTCKVVAWAAKTQFQLARGSEVDSQTPGKRYRVDAQATLTATGGGQQIFTNILSAGQFDKDPYNPPGHTPDDLPDPRSIAVAHPLAVSTRGASPTSLSGSPNVLGWTTGIAPDNSNTDLTELMANGNRLTDQNFNYTTAKDLLAPMGMIGHGSTGLYSGVDDKGARVPALYVSDRSNLYKLRQPLNNVRVDRSNMHWGWNPNNGGLYGATGNVMNPLPWETFPNTVPNVSPDYPDLDRTRATFRGGGVDMSVRPIALPLARLQPNGGSFLKVLFPLQIDLQVSIPQYQPANVNLDYFDITGAGPGANGYPQGVLAPMVISKGKDPLNGGSASLKGLISPSAGYVGQYFVYLDSNGDGRLQSVNAPGATQQTISTGRDEVFRQIAVATAVAPDVSLRTQEETIDLGKLPHSAGYTPAGSGSAIPVLPLAPSGLGPYAVAGQYVSPWDVVRNPGMFRPFTVQNRGNVNLINLRVAKIAGDITDNKFAVTNPAYWTHLSSDQVENATGVGNIFGPPFNPLGTPAVGNIGLVSSLDHGNSFTNFEWDYGNNNMWPQLNPYVPGNVLPGWNANTQPRPTLHKALPGDTSPTVLSLPDVSHGDPGGLLASIATGGGGVPGRDVRPQVSLAIPLGTPAGTYSAPIYTFEDAIPSQWRQWSQFYAAQTGGVDSTQYARDDDGVLNVATGPGGSVPIESFTNPTYRLKVTVTEARLTDGPVIPQGAGNRYLQGDDSFPQIDLRPVGAPAFGANIQVAAWRDQNRSKNQNPNMYVFWASNRLPNNPPNWIPPGTPDSPWYILFSRLNAVFGANVLDWTFEQGSGNSSSWFEQPTNVFPTGFVGSIKNLFPSDTGDLPAGANSPLVPGVISPASERHAAPAVAQDDDPSKANRPSWLFWQGAVYKSTGAGGSFRLDTRTFYTPLVNGVPTFPGAGVPYSFLNDPVLPKFSPKPLILTDVNGNTRAYLFWYGGAQGRTRLYFNTWPNRNTNTPFLTDVSEWSRDRTLPTPGALQWQADPVPVHRLVWNNGALVDAIDLVYTGALNTRKQAETILTRYLIGRNGDLSVLPLPYVDQEIMARDGVTQTWQSRDLAWQFLDPVTQDFVDANGHAPYTVTITHSDGTTVVPTVINGTPARPTQDPATGRLYFPSALGGQMVVDPQAGRITFTSVPPRATDRVTLRYTPQSLRLNVTRTDASGIPQDNYYKTPNPAPLGDASVALTPPVSAPGANSEPVGFIDRSFNPFIARDANAGDPYPKVMIPGPNNKVAALVDRYWVLYRKTNSNTTAPASIYYKTMRLTVKLPRGVLVDPGQNGKGDPTPNVIITGNLGPVEVDWARGRLYFTEADEGNVVTVNFAYSRDNQGNKIWYQGKKAIDYRVRWQDELSAAAQPADQTTGESLLPTDAAVNEGQLSAFKDPFLDKVWVFWSSTRAGTTSLYYMAISPRFYPVPAL